MALDTAQTGPHVHRMNGVYHHGLIILLSGRPKLLDNLSKAIAYRSLIITEQVTRIDFIFHIVQGSMMAVGHNHITDLLELRQISDHT